MSRSNTMRGLRVRSCALATVTATIIAAGTACSPDAGATPSADPAGEVPSRTTPPRTAAGDAELRRLVVELAATKACDLVRGTMTALHDPARQADTGTFWVEGCEVSVDGRRATFRISGSGWDWLDQVQLGAKSGTAARSYQRFDLAMELSGSLSVAYDPVAKTAALTFVPDAMPDLQVTPTSGQPANATLSEIPVRDAVLGALVTSLAGVGPASSLATSGFDVLDSGISATLALCTGAWLFRVDGRPAITSGEAPVAPVELGSRGLSLTGPLGGSEVTIYLRPRRGHVRARLMCQRDAAAVGRAYLAGTPAPAVPALATATVRTATTLHVAGSHCPIALVLEPAPGTGARSVSAAWYRPAAERPPRVSSPPLHCTRSGIEASVEAPPPGVPAP